MQLVSRMMCCGVLLLPGVAVASGLVSVALSSNGIVANTTTSITVTLTNVNTLYPLKVNSINNFSAPSALNASISSNSCNGHTLPINGTCTFVVSLTPTSGTATVASLSFSLSANNLVYPQVYSSSIAVFNSAYAGHALLNITAGPLSSMWATEPTNQSIYQQPTALTLGTNHSTTLCELTGGTSTPYGITQGSDGNIWFTDKTYNAIGKMLSEGTCTDYTTTTGSSAPEGITPGVAGTGTVWFTESATGKIGSITLSSGVLGTEFSVGNAPNSIVLGADNRNMWITDPTANAIDKFVLATSSATAYSANLSSSAGLTDITVDAFYGNVWFTEHNHPIIGKIDPATGTITEYSIPFSVLSAPQPYGITAKADGNLWFTDDANNAVWKLDPSTCVGTSCTFVKYAIPSGLGTNPKGITTDANGNIWFVNSSGYIVEF